MMSRGVLSLGVRSRCRAGDDDGVASFFVAGGRDDVDLEAGDIAGQGQAGVGEELARVVGEDGADHAFVVGRVIGAGAKANLVAEQVRVLRFQPFRFRARCEIGSRLGDRCPRRADVSAPVFAREFP